MLTYKAMFKFVQDGVHAEILDFPGVITFGASHEEARRLLASALVDMAETSLLLGEPLPRPDPGLTDPEADLEEPIHLLLTGALGPGRLGWLPTQVPHRSGLAHHAHPVPHLMNSRPARSVVGTWTWFRSRCTCQVSLQRLMRRHPLPLTLSFTHISLLTEVLTVINLAAIFHNTVHLFELSNEPNENTITV